MDSFVNEYSSNTFFAYQNIFYHSYNGCHIPKCRFFVPYTYQHPEWQNTIIQLDLSKQQKRFANLLRSNHVHFDLNNLMFQIAKGNVACIIVDSFDNNTYKLYNAIRYVEAPLERVKIIKPISILDVCLRLTNYPEKVKFLTIDPETYICHPTAGKAFEIFDEYNNQDNNNGEKLLKYPSGITFGALAIMLFHKYLLE